LQLLLLALLAYHPPNHCLWECGAVAAAGMDSMRHMATLHHHQQNQKAMKSQCFRRPMMALQLQQQQCLTAISHSGSCQCSSSSTSVRLEMA
jgi:hypothetical protein